MHVTELDHVEIRSAAVSTHVSENKHTSIKLALIIGHLDKHRLHALLLPACMECLLVCCSVARMHAMQLQMLLTTIPH